MDSERKISKKELNMLIMKLPSPIRAHSERASLIAAYLVERLKTKSWFVSLDIDPQYIIEAVYYHDIGKCRVERDYHHAFHCTAPHRRERYESHVAEGIEAVKEEFFYYLPAFERPSFEWCLCRAITEHHEELTGTGFPEGKDTRGISIVGRIAAIADCFDNMLFVGAMGTFDFDSAVSELYGRIGALDKRLVNIFLADLDGLREFAKGLYDAEVNKPAPDSYGIKLGYTPRFKAEEKGVNSYVVSVKVNDPYYGELNAEILSPIGDRSGQIIRFEKVAFKKLCEELDSIWTPDRDIPSVVFPISAQQFKNKDFYRYVMEITASYEVEPSKICFALTEADMVSSAIEWRDALAPYVSAGFKFSVNNAGDRFSIISALDDLPIASVCMKVGFLDGMTTSSKTKALVIGYIKMLETMEIDAEFSNVRKSTDAELLVAIGVKYLSGDYYGESVTVETLRGDGMTPEKEVAADE